MGASYDEGRITLIANEVAEAIEQASFGRVPWTLPAQIFSDAFPGGFAALINQDFVHDSINFMEWVNLDEHAAATYVEHFAYINPWADIWTQLRSGSVFVAEQHRPARMFTNTEFYNDWLAPQGDVVGGAGLKVDASPTDVIYFPMHYPGSLADIYDHPAAEVSRRIVGSIERAIDFSGSLVATHDQKASKAAITDRAWPSLVVDASLKLCSANAEAEELIAKEHTVICRNGRIAFKDRHLHRYISSAVTTLVSSPASPSSTLSWGGQNAPTVYSLSRLPGADSFPRSLISERRQVLVVIKRLTRAPALRDVAAFGRLYGLTGAEMRLCLSLYAGRNLQEAAAELGIGYETVRTRLKGIFAKTVTHSQSELCALLARYAG
jgi:DNA-binding CsgD family transcriptional regulator